ncbi:hypothetical protein CKAH01_07820, partial [Colletotrichum kahawae]
SQSQLTIPLTGRFVSAFLFFLCKFLTFKVSFLFLSSSNQSLPSPLRLESVFLPESLVSNTSFLFPFFLLSTPVTSISPFESVFFLTFPHSFSSDTYIQSAADSQHEHTAGLDNADPGPYQGDLLALPQLLLRKASGALSAPPPRATLRPSDGANNARSWTNARTAGMAVPIGTSSLPTAPARHRPPMSRPVGESSQTAQDDADDGAAGQPAQDDADDGDDDGRYTRSPSRRRSWSVCGDDDGQYARPPTRERRWSF